jgi:putative ABC transport system permease protein
VLGTVTGLLCGVFIGWGLVRALDGAGTGTGVFVAPPTTLVLILVAGALAGVLAAIRPARRAARLEILEAVTWA